MEFRKILVPIDYTVNTQIAVKKAIELSCADAPSVYLLHIMNSISDHPREADTQYQSITKADRYQREISRLQKLRLDIYKNTTTNASVETMLVEGNIEETIVKKAKALHIELIILGQTNSQRVFSVFNVTSPDRIARLTNCNLLKVNPGAIDRKINSIVVPVEKIVPIRKLEVAATLAQRFSAKIHLVTLSTSGTNRYTHTSNSILQTIETLQRLGCSSSIEHKTVEGDNLLIASLKYAEAIDADLILVNPDLQTRIPSFTGQEITDRVMNSSSVQILQVAPYQIPGYEFIDN